MCWCLKVDRVKIHSVYLFLSKTADFTFIDMAILYPSLTERDGELCVIGMVGSNTFGI